MSSQNMMIITGTDFNPETQFTFTKPKPNSSGGKSVGIINKESLKGLYLTTPLMLTWGVNENIDEKSGNKSYDLALQFPREEYNNEAQEQFLVNMKNFEAKIKKQALENSKEWFNKPKMSEEVIDALWTPMLKYPKDKDTGEFDYTRPPTLRIKLNYWDHVFKCEMYDMDKNLLFPNETGVLPVDLITKASNIATVIQCGGLWFASGKFGVTWRLQQAVVKPKESLLGKCHIDLSDTEKNVLKKQVNEDSEDDSEFKTVNKTVVQDSDDEEDVSQDVNVKQEVEEAVKETLPVSVPVSESKKKPVVRKKKAEATA